VKIIIFTENKFDSRDYHRYGVDKLLDAGFQVIVFNLCKLLRSEDYNINHIPENEINDNYVINILSYEHFLSLLEAEKASDVFVACYIGLGNYSKQIFRILSSKKIRYAIFRVSIIPIENYYEDLFFKVASFIKYNIFHPEISPAAIVFFAGKKAMQKRSGYKLGKNTVIRQVGSLDYNIYRTLKKSNADLLSTEVFPEIVFLDEYYPLHPDIDLNVYEWVTSKFYFEKVNFFLEEYSKKMNMSCGIAVHPRANYQENPFKFKIYHKRTAELVCNAKIIVGHASTAFSFAILDSKPIIQLGFRCTEKTVYGKSQKHFSKILGLPICYLDELYTFPEINVNIDLYNKYIEDYIITNRTIPITDHNEAFVDFLKLQLD
jgi:hypothetical protein